jgi:hypothetical protein
MKVYEVVIGNHLDSTNYSKLVVSCEPLTKNSYNINPIVGIDEEWHYVLEVKVPKIATNPWTKEEWDEMEEFKNKYF